MRILSANQQPAVRNAGGYREFLSMVVRARWEKEISWELDEKAPPILAYINRGDWVADCDLMAETDFPCGGSVVVEPTDPVFMCDECLNMAFDFKVRKLKVPSKTNRLVIEELLTMRPHPALRNYRPQDGDTVKQLQEENSHKPWLNKAED